MVVELIIIGWCIVAAELRAATILRDIYLQFLTILERGSGSSDISW